MSSYSKSVECTTGGGGFGKFIILLFLAAIGISMISYVVSHADKHGSAALAGRLLCDGQQADKIYINERINRCAYMTEEDTGKVFIQIIEEIDGLDHEITMYIKDNWKAALDAVGRYGYSPIIQ